MKGRRALIRAKWSDEREGMLQKVVDVERGMRRLGTKVGGGVQG